MYSLHIIKSNVRISIGRYCIIATNIINDYMALGTASRLVSYPTNAR